MDFKIGDMVTMKKSHPCGGFEWEILRVGMDFRIRCLKCGRTLMLPRTKFEKGLKKNFESKDFESKDFESKDFGSKTFESKDFGSKACKTD